MHFVRNCILKNLAFRELALDLRHINLVEYISYKGEIDSIRHAFKFGEKMEPQHEPVLDASRQYLVVGGMPRAVERYVESYDFATVDRKKRDLLKLYRKGIKKQAKRYALRVERIYDEVPGQLSRHEKHFNLSSLGSNPWCKSVRPFCIRSAVSD